MTCYSFFFPEIDKYTVFRFAHPCSIVQAEAERRKRAQILESEGTSQAKINVAEARKQEQILAAEGRQTEVVLVAEAKKKEVVLAAEGMQ